MAYYAGAFIPRHEAGYFSTIRDIRKRESTKRDERARKMIAEMNEQRKAAGIPLPDHALVCRSMKHLPNPGIY